MVCLTDSELDCVIIAVRPLDVGARDALLRKVASALACYPATGDGVVHRVVAEIQRRHFLLLKFVTESRALGRHLTAIVAVLAGEARLPSVS